MSGFIHRFEPGDLPPLLLLHGTGADENDLIPLGRMIAPGRALLSPRGKVLENGMPRFFRRFAEGVFDQKDLEFRTAELGDFLVEAAAQYEFAPRSLIALGYSNGANIAASLLLRRPEALAGAILLRAMLPFEPSELPDLTGKPVFLSSGDADPIIPAENSKRLADLLTQAGARVTHNRHSGGHGLEAREVELAGTWFREVTGG